jgi:hypothetical protein
VSSPRSFASNAVAICGEIWRADQASVEYASVRRVVELASGQVRLELWIDEAAGVSCDVVLPAGTAMTWSMRACMRRVAAELPLLPAISS